MSKKEQFGAFFASAGKTAKGLFDKAVQAADQTGDGKFDLSDVNALKEGVSNTLKNGTQALKERAGETARQLELKALQPIFPTQTKGAISLDDTDFFIPKFIRIVPRDKKHAESSVCQGSIGYIVEQKSFRTVNLFRDSLDAFGLNFYPDCDSEFYYIDPSDCDTYIALNEYFAYLKIARISELKKIAQDLGAKHFKVTYKEKCISFTGKKVTTNTKIATMNGDVAHHTQCEQYAEIKVMAETNFPGHTPIKPQLKYLQRDKNIQTLIAMRMNESSPLLQEHLELEMCNSSGMKLEDAVKIDAILKGLKCVGNATVVSEVQNEERRCLEYDIEF